MSGEGHMKTLGSRKKSKVRTVEDKGSQAKDKEQWIHSTKSPHTFSEACTLGFRGNERLSSIPPFLQSHSYFIISILHL